MIDRTNYLAILLAFIVFSLFNAGLINPVYAGQNNTEEEVDHIAPNRIYGKVTDIIDVSGYTYAEIDTGETKVWAAGPVTPLKTGDMVAFLTDMPMENFHSKSMKRDFSIIYFVNRFITDNEAPTTKSAAIASPHGQIKQEQAAKPVIGINKIEGGNSIAEIYANKHDLNGKTLRVRGQVTKFTSEVMDRNWVHIRDSSTLDDLTVTTDSTVAIDDVVVIEGKLKLDKDFSYGYVYPVILEDARIIKE